MAEDTLEAANARIEELEAALAECEGTPEPEPEPDGDLKIIGMSAPKDQWSQRLSEVGKSGITARRIFAKLDSSGDDQMDLVRSAHDAGMIPIYSFKVPSVSDAKAGKYDAWVRTLVDNLVSFGKTTTVTFWHEPHGDMNPSDFVAIQQRYLPLVKGSQYLSFGPLLNGWLLDNKVGEFTSYTNSALRRDWDFIGIDTYESGDMNDPGDSKPGDRMPLLEDWLADQGVPDKRVVIGEYNGYSGDTIRDAGEAFLSSPNVWIAAMWNSTEGKGYVLEGERLAAFKETKADDRVRQSG